MAEVVFSFQIQLVKPDRREYGRAVELVPASPVNVAVFVPLEHTLIANAAEIISASLEGDKVMPILTPAGLKFVTDKLEQPYEPVEVSSSDFSPSKDDNENWSGGESTDEKEFKEATESLKNEQWESESEAPANVLDTEAGWQEEESTDGNEHPEDTVDNETWS